MYNISNDAVFTILSLVIILHKGVLLQNIAKTLNLSRGAVQYVCRLSNIKKYTQQNNKWGCQPLDRVIRHLTSLFKKNRRKTADEIRSLRSRAQEPVSEHHNEMYWQDRFGLYKVREWV